MATLTERGDDGGKDNKDLNRESTMDNIGESDGRKWNRCSEIFVIISQCTKTFPGIVAK